MFANAINMMQVHVCTYTQAITNMANATSATSHADIAFTMFVIGVKFSLYDIFTTLVFKPNVEF